MERISTRLGSWAWQKRWCNEQEGTGYRRERQSVALAQAQHIADEAVKKLKRIDKEKEKKSLTS